MQEERIYYPLTISQRTVLPPLFLPKHEDVFIRTVFSVVGECDVGALEKAFLHLIETQDTLRARLHIGWHGIEQYITDYAPFSVPIVALGEISELDAAIRSRHNAMKNPLFGGPLYHAVIFTYAGGASLLAIFSHLCFDGYSCALAEKQIREAYFAYAGGETPLTPRRRYTYADYCAEDQRYRASGREAEDLAFWKERFRQKPHLSRFLPRFSLRAVYSPLKTRNFILDGALYSAMADFCRRRGVSASYFLSATAALAAGRLTGKPKVLFTGLSHGRSTVPRRQLVGMMVNTFPAIFDLSDGQTVADYYVNGYLNYLESVKHSNVSIYRSILGSLTTWLRQGYFPTCSEVFIGLLEFSETPADPRFSAYFVPPHYFFSQFYLLFSDNHTDRALVSVSYQSRRYSEECIEQLIETYRAILADAISHPDQTVGQLMRGETLPDAQSVAHGDASVF